jgi:hypothetical protein
LDRHGSYRRSAAIGADGSTGYGSAGQCIMLGPAQFNTDYSLGKTTRVGGVREDASLGTATFGVITQNSVAPRLIQFAVKYLF